MNYPHVFNEFETIARLQEGYSISRFGDGELKMMGGAGYVREPPNKKLAHELRQVLRKPPPKLLRAIPTMDPRGPKYSTWQKHRERFNDALRRTREPFYSAFISRPDSAPWIRTPEFAAEFAKLWRGKRIWLLAEDSSKTHAMLDGEEVVHQVCPRHKAYAHIDDFETAARAAKPDIAILSCGMTATCLAARLCAKGIQAIDFGSGGKFLTEMLRA